MFPSRCSLPDSPGMVGVYQIDLRMPERLTGTTAILRCSSDTSVTGGPYRSSDERSKWGRTLAGGSRSSAFSSPGLASHRNAFTTYFAPLSFNNIHRPHLEAGRHNRIRKVFFITSPAKLAANRANARHSTGPADTSRTRLNGLQHGLTSSQTVIQAKARPTMTSSVRVSSATSTRSAPSSSCSPTA